VVSVFCSAGGRASRGEVPADAQHGGDPERPAPASLDAAAHCYRCLTQRGPYVCVCGLCVQLVAVLREVKYLLMRNMEEIPRGVRQRH